MMSLPYSAPNGQVLHTPHIIGSNLGPTRVIGSGAIKSENFSSGSAGWSIDGDGNVEFNSGNFRGDITGASGSFSGAVTASSIDIDGDADPTTSFHVDGNGNMWIGASTFASGKFKVTSGGVVTATDITITGGSQNIGSGTWVVGTDGNVTVGGTLTVAGTDGNLKLSVADGLVLPVDNSEVTPVLLGKVQWRLQPPAADTLLGRIEGYYDSSSNIIATRVETPAFGMGIILHVADEVWEVCDKFLVESGGSEIFAASSLGISAMGRIPSSTYRVDLGYDTMRLASGTSGHAYLQFGASSTAAQNTHLVNNGSNGLLVYSGNAGSGTLRYGFYTNLPHPFVWGEWSGGAAYSAFSTSGATTTGYLMLTDNGTTYISTVNSGHSVYIRPSANSTTYQIIVSTSSVAATLTGTASGNTVRDAGFGALGYFTSRAATKENIKTVKGKDALDRVLALRPVEFNFKKDYIGDGTNDLVVFDRKRGFVAEEVEAVDRAAAIYGWLEPGNPKKLAGPREDKLPIEDAVAIQWSPEAMVADLVAVVQDLHERIITLEAKK